MAKGNDFSELVLLAQLVSRWDASEVKLGDERAHWRYEGDKGNERRPTACIMMVSGHWDIHITWRYRSQSGVATESKVYLEGGRSDGTLPPEFVEFMDEHFKREG